MLAMQSGPAVHSEGSLEPRRYEALLEMADLIVRHQTLPELYHEMALGLRKVADFKFLNFSLYHPENKLMQLYYLEGDPASGFPTVLPVDESPTGWSWQHQQELIFHNLEHEVRFPRMLEELRSRGIRTYYVLPLTTGEKRLGGLGVASVKINAYQEPDRRFLRRVAELIALVIENAATREALREEKDRLRALVDINRTLASRLEVQSLLPLISECVTRVVPHDFAGVTLFEGDRENLKAYVLSPQRPQAIVESGRPVSLNQTLSAQAFLEGQAKTLTRNDLESHGSTIARRILGAGIRTMRCVPLLTSTGTLGTLNVGRKKDQAFSWEDEEILNQIAAQLAIALDNARAYGEIQALRDRLAQEKLYLEDEIRSELNFEEIIGESAELKHVLSQARTVAPNDSTVLILGETGTGKELIARAIHRMSKRRDSSFIKVNCASIPTGLLESELFGHEKGAFTGAVSKKVGRMELADKGTLFLDEVGDIPMELQPKLLHVLQDHEFERLGSNRTVRVDLRLVAATNRDLSKRITEGEFRSDLFYRLNVFPIHIPPLRARRKDIPLLVRHFVKKIARRMDKHIDTIPSQTMEALVNWHWPGNVRELENLIERSVILSEALVLRSPLTELQAEAWQTADSSLEQAEREHIIRVLRECGGRVAGAGGAAVKLGLKRTTLQSKMGKLKIDRKDYAT
jgi:formate hydrogenlyase transcriptional activator